LLRTTGDRTAGVAVAHGPAPDRRPARRVAPARSRRENEIGEGVVADAPRARRLAKRIAQIVASAIEHEIKDPRLAKITITDTKITADLHDATVYYTVLPDRLEDRPDVEGAAVALEAARGKLRTMVGQ